MKTVVADVLARFLAALPTGDDACLIADQVSAPDATSIDRAPFWTVLVRGRHDGQEGPHALILLTFPSRAADAPEVLEFAVRRARANKAPYFVTWTLRDAIIWQTPKPGVPAARDALEKLRDYPDLYEIDPSASRILDGSIERIALRGADICGDLVKLAKDGALKLFPVDKYILNRLIDGVRRLLPIVTNSIRSRLVAEIGSRSELSAWAAEEGIDGASSDERFAKSIAWGAVFPRLRKVVLYQTVRGSARQLRKFDSDRVDTAEVMPNLRAAFANVRGFDLAAVEASPSLKAWSKFLGFDFEALKTDYGSVFEETFDDRLAWPAEASRELAALIRDIATRDFASLPREVIDYTLAAMVFRVLRGGRKFRVRHTSDEKEATEELLRQFLPHGPKRFPEEFYFGTTPSGMKEFGGLPEQPLFFQNNPLFTGLCNADSSFRHSLPRYEAKYVLYAHRAGHRKVRLPDEMIALTRAVANYEKYLREMYEQLYETYLSLTFDNRDAARLTDAAFDRFRLPTPESIE